MIGVDRVQDGARVGEALEDRHELDPLCLLGRARVRRALGLPRDRYDDLTDRMRPGMVRRVAAGE